MLDDDARYQCQVGPGPQGTINPHFERSLHFVIKSIYLIVFVVVIGQPGIRSKFAKISVLVPPEPPKILQGDFLVTTEDREIELECVSVGGKPAAEVILFGRFFIDLNI